MKSSIDSLGPSVQKIVTQIQKVQLVAEKASKSNGRFAAYRYLRAVLRAYRYFEERNLIPNLTQIAPSVLMTPVRANWHPMRIIIEATCQQPDLRMRSRWTRALEYAVAEDIEPEELTRFMKANNGVAGCADLASKTKLKHRPGPTPGRVFSYRRPTSTPLRSLR